MSNSANLGLAQGFMQGFGFMDRMATNKQSREYRDKLMGRQEELHQNKLEAHENSVELHGLKMEEHQREKDKRLLQGLQVGFKEGNVDPKLLQEYADRFDIDLHNYADPEFGSALQTLEGTINGEVKLNSPEFKSAFSKVFGKEIKRGVGEETEDGGKITDKMLRAVVPSQDGNSLMIDLDVLKETREGSKWYSAPVTEGRSSTDEYVKQVPLTNILDKLQGHKLMYQAAQESPELMSLFKQHAAMTGLQLPQEKKKWGGVESHKELGFIQTDPNGQIHVLKENESAPENLVVNDQLVDPKTGKVLGDYRDPEADGSGVGGNANDGLGGIKSSVLSNIRAVTEKYWGKFNPEGGFMGFPAGTEKKFSEANARTMKLLKHTDLDAFSAAHIANLSLSPDLTPQKAREIAERMADDQGIDDEIKDKWIQSQSRKLMNDDGKAKAYYDKVMSGVSSGEMGLNNVGSPSNTQPNDVKALDVPAPKPQQTQAPTKQNTSSNDHGVVKINGKEVRAPKAAIQKLQAMMKEATTKAEMDTLLRKFHDTFTNA